MGEGPIHIAMRLEGAQGKKGNVQQSVTKPTSIEPKIKHKACGISIQHFKMKMLQNARAKQEMRIRMDSGWLHH